MTFPVSICLTNQGSLSLGPTLTIYGNPISPLNPGNFIRTVSKTSITGANCPYSFSVPLGTQTIRIFDPVSFCYVDIPVSDNNVCNSCSLGLNSISNNVIGQINVGSLTGNCDNSITDYTIKWYGPDSTTNFAFSSGQGTLFSGQYQYTQPLTPSNSPVLNPGVYVARITNVELNGLKFTSTGGTGNITSCALTSCTTNVTVDTYSCLNGNPSTTNGYGHYRNFSYTGALPPSLSTTKLKLSAGTQYVVFAFVGYSVFDNIKFTLSGSAYQSPIQLENISVGDIAGNNFNPTTWPKSADTTGFFSKIINLTGLTINQNDIIDITITPNSSTNETDWQLYFGCSTKPTGSKTCLDTYKNTPYKIKQSTIPATLTQSAAVCPATYSLSFKVSGCSSNNNNLWNTSTLYKFTNNGVYSSNIDTDPNDNNLLALSFGSFYDSYSNISLGLITNLGQICQSSVGADYRIEKVPGFLKFYFRNINDLYTFGNSFNATKTQTTNFISSTGPYTTNNTDIDYYRFIVFTYKDNDICGDGASSNSFYIPVNSSLTSGTTGYLGYSYIMTITLPQQTYSNSACPVGNCECSELSSIVNDLNTYTNQTIAPFTRTRLLTNPFNTSYYYYSSTEPANTSSSQSGYIVHPYTYGDKTYPASGGTNYNNTLLPSLPNGSTTWDWTNHFYISGNDYQQYVFYYTVKAKTPLSSLGFEIWAYSISNFGLGTDRKIYDSATGVVPTETSFFV
jgi:hypothetical protein